MNDKNTEKIPQQLVVTVITAFSIIVAVLIVVLFTGTAMIPFALARAYGWQFLLIYPVTLLLIAIRRASGKKE